MNVRILVSATTSLHGGFEVANVVHFVEKVVSQFCLCGLFKSRQVIAELRFERLVEPCSVKDVLISSALEDPLSWITLPYQPATPCFRIVQQSISYLNRKAAPCASIEIRKIR